MSQAMPRRPRAWMVALFALCLVFGFGLPMAYAGNTLADPSPPLRTAPVLMLDGAIGPASADYVVRGIADGVSDGAPFILIRMDTPGGLDTSMREIIRAIVNSPLPIITYVSPSGARAASAGAFILISSHVAAMAPGTNVGAATPVQLGGSNPLSGPQDQDDQSREEQDKSQKPQESGSAPASATDAKALNDAIAYIRSLAEMRGRDADWAEAAVREAASLSAQSALERGIIDVVARDSTELMAALDGRMVQLAGGEVRLDTAGVALAESAPNWRTRLLMALTNPNIALILMMIGAYGLLFEFMSPGALYPGTIGAISLLLGLYALTALPVNYAGVALILLGMALMAAEAFAPSFGILGIGGLIAFVLGALVMFDTDVPQFRVALPVLAAVAFASLGATLLTVRLALSARHHQVVSGREEMVGSIGRVIDWSEGRGHVHVHGERWAAHWASHREEQGVHHPLQPGTSVQVTGIDGLLLSVEPAADPIITGEGS